MPKIKESRNQGIINSIVSNPKAGNEKVLSLFEASKLCTYSQEYLSLLSRKGLIGSQKKGRNWVITREALFDYIEKNSADKKGRAAGLTVVMDQCMMKEHKKLFKLVA